MEDLETTLANYKLQLQQVEAALTTSPTSEELLKLKVDLEEVIRLTCDLIKSQIEEEKNAEARADRQKSKPKPVVKTDWCVGDDCLALYIPDGKYYEATIESIEGEEVTVAFASIKSTEVTTLEYLKPLPEGSAYRSRSALSRKHFTQIREYQKKRKLKKMQRFKQLEEERETEKNKWLAFSTKTSKKGVVKKSIFASPDNVNGRVGVGTCGLGGKGMTEFTSAEKWRKGV